MTPAPSSAEHISVAPPRLRDIPALRRLFQAALSVDFQYFARDYVHHISHQNSLWRLMVARCRRDRVMVVARDQGTLIGYAIGSLTPGGHGELYWLYVDRAYRHHRIGSRLLQAGLEQLHQRGAERVTLVTYGLKDYYIHQGFTHHGTQYIHGLDLDVMEYRWHE